MVQNGIVMCGVSMLWKMELVCASGNLCYARLAQCTAACDSNSEPSQVRDLCC